MEFTTLMNSIQDQVCTYIKDTILSAIRDVSDTYDISYDDIIKNSPAVKEFLTSIGEFNETLHEEDGNDKKCKNKQLDVETKYDADDANTKTTKKKKIVKPDDVDAANTKTTKKKKIVKPDDVDNEPTISTCNGYTKSGGPCKYKCSNGDLYCKKHSAQQLKSKTVVDSVKVSDLPPDEAEWLNDDEIDVNLSDLSDDELTEQQQPIGTSTNVVFQKSYFPMSDKVYDDDEIIDDTQYDSDEYVLNE